MPVIMAGHDALGSVLFGQPTQNSVSYFDSVRERISLKADVYKQDFIDTSKQIFDSVYSSRALELSRAAINKAGALFMPDVIKELRTMSDFQTAKPTMQRFIMANPVVRQKWMDGRCEGYGDNYVDFDPGLIGDNHYDYRMVMNGVAQVDQETGEMFRNIYQQEIRDGDIELTELDQFDILNSYAKAEHFMAQAAKDLTSEWNCDL